MNTQTRTHEEIAASIGSVLNKVYKITTRVPWVRHPLPKKNKISAVSSLGILQSKLNMGWLRLVGSLKKQVAFAEYRFFYRALLQKRPMVLRSVLDI